MKKTILLIIALLPLSVLNAQFVNIGITGGLGFGGIHGKGLDRKTGLNPEIGFVFKYNITEQISIRTLITVDIHKVTLKGGKQVENNLLGPPYIVTDASDNSFGYTSATQHVDLTYILKEDKFDISGGVFWSVGFTKTEIEQGPRIFYNATDAEIIGQSNTPSVFQTEFGDSNPTEFYALDQIKKSMRGVTGGLYLAASGGTEKFKVMLRYDMFLKNYYSAFSTTNKLKENYFRLGLIYFWN
jgi:hypothetical protein